MQKNRGFDLWPMGISRHGLFLSFKDVTNKDGEFESPTSGTVNNYKSGMALKFNVYDKDFSLKDPGDGMQHCPHCEGSLGRDFP